ncbi:DUF4301 family protein [Changchengzhania lutea]|uniref:DUF4301 family protein n=1 Tax=Changchengzhania lutea TaxID=2049305 RepID=UPI00115F534C|nr:DUF4301 family protein [Changchengzhania lutea]
MKLSEKDFQQIKDKGITLEKIQDQIDIIKSGMAFSRLKKAATVKDGILKVSEDEASRYVSTFEEHRDSISMLKFVPASGAATRMFKFLFQFLEDYKPSDESIDNYAKRCQSTQITAFVSNLEKFPFYAEVIKKTKQARPDFDKLSHDEKSYAIVKTMLKEDLLNYSFSPKGLLPFHKYDTNIATAFEEHFFEGAHYASSHNKADLHFTISEIHKEKFEKELLQIKAAIESKTDTNFEVSFSYQKQSTDMVALNFNESIVRQKNGNILFRPSGHGALLENLNDLDYDVIFIKNIDNVVVKRYHEDISKYKKVLAGILLSIQNQTFQFIKTIDKGEVSEQNIQEIVQFLHKKLNVVVGSDFNTQNSENKIAYLMDKLNRPIRACGMVKNEGEPGGGPFWVEDNQGSISLQIVESAQIDSENKKQMQLLKNATHFNPVDLVCGIKNHKGEKFDLTQFVDYNAAFITDKTHNGNDIKALELPGLWNGSMAFWNTIFVEVPLITFNPVKTANDLLKEAHQAS